MTKKQLTELAMKALSPLSVDEYCFPLRWAIALAMIVIVSSTAIAVALFVRSGFCDQFYWCLGSVAFLCGEATIFVWRFLSGKRDVEIKKLEVIEALIKHAQDIEERKIEVGFSACETEPAEKAECGEPQIKQHG